MIGTKSIPAVSSNHPKVRRETPVSGSRPIIAVSRPITAATSPLTSALPDRLMIRLRPRKVSAKYSGGPNISARRAIGGAKKVSPISPMRSGDKGGDRGDPECGTRPPLLRQLVAVDRGGDR